MERPCWRLGAATKVLAAPAQPVWLLDVQKKLHDELMVGTPAKSRCPPQTRTRPSLSKVAVWLTRACVMLFVTLLHELVTGS